MNIRIDIKADPDKYERLAGDWMGETLIRAQRPEADPEKPKAICSHEGCEKVLAYHAKSGLCKEHRDPSVCGAYRCKAKLDFRNTTGYCRSHVNWRSNNRAG